MDEIEINEDVICIKSVLEGWYTLERKDHEPKEWMEADPVEENVCHLRYSGRISDADVEGTRQQMLNIANAILDKTSYEARRCAVEVKDDKVYLWSPRNSMKKAVLSFERAKQLADNIVCICGDKSLNVETFVREVQQLAFIRQIKRIAFNEGYKAAIEDLAKLYENSGFKVIAEAYRQIEFKNPYEKKEQV